APAAQRVGAMVRTLAGVPKMLADGRARLRTPLPKPFVQLALSIGQGLPAHFAEAEAYATARGLGADFAEPRAVAEAAVARFVGWLRDELPGAVPDFALGPERFQRLLFVREGIEAPFDELRRAGAADLARNQARLAEIGRQHGTTFEAILRRMGDDHPPAGEVVPTAQRCVDEALAFVRAHDLVSIPTPLAVRVEETPVWARALSTASMNPPGPSTPGRRGSTT
ncbi:lipoprotein, partial [mine drainage metagenome]